MKERKKVRKRERERKKERKKHNAQSGSIRGLFFVRSFINTSTTPILTLISPKLGKLT